MGDTVVPAGAKLVSVGGRATGDMSYSEAIAVAMTGTHGTELGFE